MYVTFMAGMSAIISGMATMSSQYPCRCAPPMTATTRSANGHTRPNFFASAASAIGSLPVFQEGASAPGRPMKGPSFRNEAAVRDGCDAPTGSESVSATRNTTRAQLIARRIKGSESGRSTTYEKT